VLPVQNEMSDEAAEVQSWIAAHGSTRLKAIARNDLLAGSMDLYLTERLAAERPGWELKRKAGKVLRIRSPSEAAVAAFEAARTQWPTTRLHFFDERHRHTSACRWVETTMRGSLHVRYPDCPKSSYYGPILVDEFYGRCVIRRLGDCR
jgi:hypothetical protein